MGWWGRGLWVVVLIALAPGSSGAASVICSSLTAPPGTIFVYPAVAAPTWFNGNNFVISGYDASLAGGPGSAPAILGIATATEGNAQAVLGELNSGQLDNVYGKGFVYSNPPVPSIGVVAAPDASRVEGFVTALLAGPHITVTDATIAGSVSLGTVADPVVTYLSGQGAGVTIQDNADVSGAGILVVEDGLIVKSDFDYTGLIVVRGPVAISGSPTSVGSIVLRGSLWAHGVELTASGSSQFYYSSEALALAGLAGGSAACEPAVCGDGTRTYDEACDDGNVVDGDCCSATCQLEPIGTPCTDDNVCTSEQCDGAGTCVHAPVAGACDDGDACTDGDTCVAGACVGASPVTCGACMRCDTTRGCVGAPAGGCLVPVKSELDLRRTDALDQSHLAWRWRTGQAPASSDVSWPGTDEWTFCLFGGPDGADLLSRSVLPPTGSCGGRPCWRSSASELRYDDRLRTRGITKIKIMTRLDGKVSLRVLGGGRALDLATLPVELPVTAQLRNGDDLCWEASYPSSSVVQGPAGLHGRGGP